MYVFFKENQNVSRLAMVAIDIYFIDKSTVSTSTTHNENVMAFEKQVLKNITLTAGAPEESM